MMLPNGWPAMSRRRISVRKDLIEAVAALLYNLIYDQEGRNGWTPTSSEPDPAVRNVFLCFAETLLQVLETADPEASDAEIVQKATQRVDPKAGHAWATIAMDVELVSLPKEAEKYVDAVRLFLEQPYMSVESEFLEDEDDTTEAIDENDQYIPLAGDIAVTLSSDPSTNYHYDIFDHEEWKDAGNHEKPPADSHIYISEDEDTTFYRMNPLPAINATVQTLISQVSGCNTWLMPPDRLKLIAVLKPLLGLEETVRNADFLKVVDLMEDAAAETIDEYEHRMQGETYQKEKDLREARRETQGGVTDD